MSLFGKKKEYPKLPEGEYNVVLRCSICNGEEVLCLRDKETGELRDLMLIDTEEDLKGFCRANGIAEEDIRKVY